MQSEVNQLKDLDKFRSAPDLELSQKKNLLLEIDEQIHLSDWITIGIMAPKDVLAKESLRSLLKKYPAISFKSFDHISAPGEVFLKGNQKTGNVFIRSEDGLGQGILLTCQYEDHTLGSQTYGPFPLDFFF